MSSRCVAHVFQNSQAMGSARLLLVAMADSARDDGYLSGEEFGSMNYLQRKCGFASKQTTISNRIVLEELGEIVVRRPQDRGWGRHFEYVLAMGRTIEEVCRQFKWTLHKRSTDQTEEPSEAVSATTATVPSEDSIQPATEQLVRPEGSQAVPPATVDRQATEPVDSDITSPDDRSTHQTEDGPVSVRYRSDLQRHSPYSPTHQQLAVAHGPVPGCSEPAVVDSESALEWIHRQLAGLAPGVTWNLTSRQRDQVLEHMNRWPSIDEAATALVTATVAAIADRGGPPRSARAWVTMWLTLTPSYDVDEPVCVEHQLAGYPPVPVKACAVCHDSSLPAAAASSR